MKSVKYIGLLCMYSLCLHADTIKVFNATGMPVYAALVQVNVAENTLYYKVKMGRHRDGSVLTYKIQPMSYVEMVSPSFARARGVDTEFIFSTQQDAIKTFLDGTVFGSGVGRYKVGQYGNKKLFVGEPGQRPNFTPKVVQSVRPVGQGLFLGRTLKDVTTAPEGEFEKSSTFPEICLIREG